MHAVNKITEEALRRLIECVKKQREILADEIGRGLQHLNLEVRMSLKKEYS